MGRFGWGRLGAPMEFGGVGTSHEFDAKGGTGRSLTIELGETFADLRGPDSDNRVGVWLVGGAAVKDIDADIAFFEVLGRTLHGMLHDVAKKLLTAGAGVELGGLKDAAKFFPCGLFLVGR